MTLLSPRNRMQPTHIKIVIFTLGWITLFVGDMGEGALHREDEITVKQRNKIWWPTDSRSQCNLKFELASLHCKLQTRPLVRDCALQEK
jgi:hypothetical protein